MKRSLVAIGLVVLVGAASAFAADATSAWKKVLSKCAKTDLIKNQVLFFGLSNTTGPGSVWRFADDKSIRLLFDLADALPSEADRSQVVQMNNVVPCSGVSTSSWNLKLGLPFATGATPLSLDISAALGRASKVTVSVTGFAVDTLKEVPWEQKLKGLGPSSPYVARLLAPGGILASNAVKVTGLKAEFVFGSKLSADVEAKFKGKTFVLGSADTGTGAAGASSTSSQLTAGAANPPPSSGTPATAVDAKKPTGATIHTDVTSDNTITVTADGPFYMIAAYSRIVKGAPIGIDATAAAPLILEPVKVSSGASVKSERK